MTILKALEDTLEMLENDGHVNEGICDDLVIVIRMLKRHAPKVLAMELT